MLTFVLFILIFMSSHLSGITQQPLNNEIILKMIQTGLAEDLIIKIIQEYPGKYSTDSTQLAILREAGVTERIVETMINRQLSTSLPLVPSEEEKKTIQESLRKEFGDDPRGFIITHIVTHKVKLEKTKPGEPPRVDRKFLTEFFAIVRKELIYVLSKIKIAIYQKERGETVKNGINTLAALDELSPSYGEALNDSTIPQNALIPLTEEMVRFSSNIVLVGLKLFKKDGSEVGQISSRYAHYYKGSFEYSIEYLSLRREREVGGLGGFLEPQYFLKWNDILDKPIFVASNYEENSEIELDAIRR